VRISLAVVAVVVGLFFFLPLPINRVRQVGVVQVHPDVREQVFVGHSGTLVELNVRDGQRVKEGFVLARLTNSDLAVELDAAETESRVYYRYVARLDVQYNELKDPDEKAKIKSQSREYESKRKQAEAKARDLKSREKELIIRAPRDGVVSGCPRIEEVGKFFEKDSPKPFCMVSDPTRLRVCLPVVSSELNRLDQNLRAQAPGPDGVRALEATLRIHGRDSKTWKGRIVQLPEAEAATIPWALTTHGGGPIAVKAGGNPDRLVPQNQVFLVYVDIVNPDDAITHGNMAQVKVYCVPETCAQWVWRTLNNLFDLGLM
jgi:multidrug efflux pump subunit AcrA (membrane-fusion protein)